LYDKSRKHNKKAKAAAIASELISKLVQSEQKKVQLTCPEINALPLFSTLFLGQITTETNFLDLVAEINGLLDGAGVVCTTLRSCKHRQSPMDRIFQLTPGGKASAPT
jgi:hypothetical protein